MADLIFAPSEITENIIGKTKIDEDAVYNDDGGITRAQLTLLASASATIGTIENPDGESTTLKDNVYKTIKRLSASANKKNIDFAANIKNTMYNTIQFDLMAQLDSQTTTKGRQGTMIKWLPSSANEADPFHSLQYGKTMTMQAALDKGLGTRYGCQCSMQILSAPASVDKTLKKAIDI